MKCINGKNYGGLQNILVKDNDNRTMGEIYASLDPILDIIDNYVELLETTK